MISTHVPTRSFSHTKNLASSDDGSSVIAQLTLPRGASAGALYSLSRGEGGGARHSLPLFMIFSPPWRRRRVSNGAETEAVRIEAERQTDRTQTESFRWFDSF